MNKKKKAFLIILGILILVGLYGLFKPLPEGLDVASKTYSVNESAVSFLADKTFLDQTEERQSEQEIFDEIFSMIDKAENYILIDMFLFNDFLGKDGSAHRDLSGEMIDRLITKKKADSEITIQLITDPINTVYGGYEPESFKKLKEAGIPVILTDLKKLRDSNPSYSSVWRSFFQWLPQNSKLAFLPNLFDTTKPKVNIQAYLNSFNFKANHRKVILTDYQKNGQIGFSVLVTSANPHDGSSAHSNTAVKVDQKIWRDVLASEKAVALFSGYDFIEPENLDLEEKTSGEQMKVQLLTERSIKRKIISMIDSLEKNDALDMAMFYISDRQIVRALKRADDREVKIRLLFDPNKDAFGREKNGVPNRPVTHELLKNTEGNTELRWCDTHGEQCHSKLLIFKKGESYSLIQGSANLTRRNLNNLNLESNIFISGQKDSPAIKEARSFFNETWNNESGRQYSVGYEKYRDESKFKTLLYRFGEFTGISSY